SPTTDVDTSSETRLRIPASPRPRNGAGGAGQRASGIRRSAVREGELPGRGAGAADGRAALVVILCGSRGRRVAPTRTPRPTPAPQRGIATRPRLRSRPTAQDQVAAGDGAFIASMALPDTRDH